MGVAAGGDPADDLAAMPDRLVAQYVDGERIVEIGKEIADFHAVDTGLFACGEALVACLGEVKATKGDCSLTDGMRVLLQRDRFRARDIGDAWWQDVDTPGALKHGAQLFRTYGAGESA